MPNGHTLALLEADKLGGFLAVQPPAGGVWQPVVEPHRPWHSRFHHKTAQSALALHANKAHLVSLGGAPAGVPAPPLQYSAVLVNYVTPDAFEQKLLLRPQPLDPPSPDDPGVCLQVLHLSSPEVNADCLEVWVGCRSGAVYRAPLKGREGATDTPTAWRTVLAASGAAVLALQSQWDERHAGGEPIDLGRNARLLCWHADGRMTLWQVSSTDDASVICELPRRLPATGVPETPRLAWHAGPQAVHVACIAANQRLHLTNVDGGSPLSRPCQGPWAERAGGAGLPLEVRAWPGPQDGLQQCFMVRCSLGVMELGQDPQTAEWNVGKVWPLPDWAVGSVARLVMPLAATPGTDSTPETNCAPRVICLQGQEWRIAQL